MKNSFDEAYYEAGLETGVSCYSNYRWLPELTIPLAAELISRLGICRGDYILDYGCAKGYLVKAFRLLHHRAYGVDISEYAINNAPSDVREYVSVLDGEIPTMGGEKYDWVISKDVLEHVPYAELHGVLKKIRVATRRLMIIVPLGDGERFIIPEYEQDATHHIRQPKAWWEERLSDAGFDIEWSSYRMQYVKENWASWTLGNAFILAY